MNATEKLVEDMQVPNPDYVPGATIYRYTDKDYFEVVMTFSRSMVTTFKRLPSKDRYWEPQSKRWGFKQRYFALLRNLLVLEFGEDEVKIKEQSSDPLEEAKAAANNAVRRLLASIQEK